MEIKQILEQFRQIAQQMKNFDESRESTDPILNLSEGELTYIYNIGVKFVSIGNYDQAIKLFQFLLISDPVNIQYLKALAGSLHAIKDYKNAYNAYFTVYGLDQENQYDCLFYLGACAFYLQDLDAANKYLNEFLVNSQDKKMNARAKLFIKQLESKIKEE